MVCEVKHLRASSLRWRTATSFPAAHSALAPRAGPSHLVERARSYAGLLNTAAVTGEPRSRRARRVGARRFALTAALQLTRTLTIVDGWAAHWRGADHPRERSGAMAGMCRMTGHEGAALWPTRLFPSRWAASEFELQTFADAFVPDLAPQSNLRRPG